MTNSDAPLACAIESSVMTATLTAAQIRDPLTVEKLKKTMLDALDSSGASNAIINFQNVEFIGSLAFLAFLAVRRKLGGGRVVLCELRPEVAEVFALCRLIPQPGGPPAPFEVAPSISEARLRCGLS